MKNKTQVAAHIAKHRNWDTARYHESNEQTANRLLAWLATPWVKWATDGSGTILYVTTIRAYLLKYDRPEYRRIIRAIRYNNADTRRHFKNPNNKKLNAHDLLRMDDFKAPQQSQHTPNRNIVEAFK